MCGIPYLHKLLLLRNSALYFAIHRYLDTYKHTNISTFLQSISSKVIKMSLAEDKSNYKVMPRSATKLVYEYIRKYIHTCDMETYMPLNLRYENLIATYVAYTPR